MEFAGFEVMESEQNVVQGRPSEACQLWASGTQKIEIR